MGFFPPKTSRFYGKTQRGSRDTHETDTRAHIGSIVTGLHFTGWRSEESYVCNYESSLRNANVYTYLWVGPGTQSERRA